jgi:hypothetical protein
MEGGSVIFPGGGEAHHAVSIGKPEVEGPGIAPFHQALGGSEGTEGRSPIPLPEEGYPEPIEGTGESRPFCHGTGFNDGPETADGVFYGPAA